MAAMATSLWIEVRRRLMIVDLDRGQLVDVIGARSASAVEAWLAAKPTRWAEQIRHAVIDPYQPYANALANEVPDAKLVVDHFHIIRLANAAIDEVRRRVQHDTLRHRGRKGDPLYRIRRRLLAGHEKLTPDGFDRVLAWLNHGNPDGEVAIRLSGQGTTPSRLRRRHRVRCPPMARRVLRDLRHRRGRRAHPASQDDPPLGDPAAALAHHRTHQRRRRRHQPDNQEHQTARVRVPQLRELSTPSPVALRHHMEDSRCTINTRPPTQLGRVEPVISGR